MYQQSCLLSTGCPYALYLPGVRKLYESTNTAAYVHMAFLSATCALVVGMLVKEPLPRALAAAVSLLNVVVAVGVGRTASSQRPVASAESTTLMDAKEPVHVVPSKMGCESDGDKTVVGFVGVMNDGKLRPLEAKDFADALEGIPGTSSAGLLLPQARRASF